MNKRKISPVLSFFFLVSALFPFANSATAQVRGVPAQPEKPAALSGKVSGTVWRAEDGVPLKKATVTLMPEGRGMEAVAVRTDANGKFEFPEVSPGRYQLRAQRSGFVAAIYGRRGSGPGLTINVEPGQHVEKLEFRLERAGIISGTVMDEDNEPVEGVQVRAMRVRYSPGGRERLTTARSDSTDDLGNYRLPGLAPGTYYVQAGGRGEGVRIGGPPSTVSYAGSFYPGVASREEAHTVEVTSGNETPHVDLAVKSTPTYSISGVIVDAKSGGGVRRYDVGFGSGGAMAFTSVNRDDGTFIMRGMEPGEYNLIGRVFDLDTGAPRQGYRSVKVVDADVRVVIEIGTAATVRGEVQPADDKPMKFSGLFVALQPVEEGGMSPSGVIDEKGKFIVSNVPPGKYSVELASRERDVYVKKVRCLGQDIMAGGLELRTSQTVEDCTLTVARDVGAVSGAVTHEDKPAEGMLVVLIPVEMERRKLERHLSTAQTDSNGMFEMRGVVPGDYWAFALVPSDDAIYYDLEFADRNRERATKLAVKPSEAHSLSLKVVKAR